MGAKTTVLPNVKIGNNVVIGAGSIVTNDIPDNSLAVGNPARVIGSTDDYLKKEKDKMKSRMLFDESWTERGNISEEKKEEMIEKLKDGTGYVI
ncbi:hypothetical protein PVN34_22725 [Bacillus thuringiensis]|uniref:hypothetical protein n=1 Tax=Bacillus cereus TaxID=1396 RepID=UPI00254A1984|nr:hypothetical protein [Bacillus cereus]MDD9281329.1 hypothetical protein [Bacillus thuringiensis]